MQKIKTKLLNPKFEKEKDNESWCQTCRDGKEKETRHEGSRKEKISKVEKSS